MSDAPEKARTPNLSVRSRTLYPIELLVHAFDAPNNIANQTFFVKPGFEALHRFRS